MSSPEFQVLISYFKYIISLVILKKSLALVQAATAVYVPSAVLLTSLAWQKQRKMFIFQWDKINVPPSHSNWH